MNAGTTIGSTEITAILNIERGNSSPWSELNLVDKEENLVYKQAKEAESISIDVALVEHLHSQGKSVEDQRQDLKELINNSPSNNSIDYKDVSGNLVIESVDIPESSDLPTYREGTISGFLI